MTTEIYFVLVFAGAPVKKGRSFGALRMTAEYGAMILSERIFKVAN
jgi:ribulose 1,5-bisphosphate synthetase/thiazole synthase